MTEPKTETTRTYPLRLSRNSWRFISECIAQNGVDQSAAERRAFEAVNRVLMKADKAEGAA